MATAVIVGGSVAGLASALALSGAGYRVLVLERAPEPPTGPAAQTAPLWERPTVPQTLQSHTLTSLGVRVLRERAPRVLAQALAAGARELDLTRALPAAATGREREPGDDDLVALGCRRPVLELVLHRHVSALPGVTFRHGTTVDALELDQDGRRVRAVVTRTGGRIPADVVVDATGRRALSRSWLRGCGIPLAEDLSGPSGLSGYSRCYRLKRPSASGEFPSALNRGHGVGDIWDHYAGVLHPGDNGTFSIALGTLPGDRALSGLRTEAGFTAAATATPGIGPWLDPQVSEPLSTVHTMTSPPNSLWGPASSRQYPVAGLFPVGDAACVTNPLFGRGLSLALAHAFRLADVLTERPRIDAAQRRAVARMTEELFLPWYTQSVASDRARIARWRSAVNGTPAWAGSASEGCLPTIEEIAAAAQRDGTVWRGLTRMLMTLSTPAELFSDAEFLARVRRTPPSAGDGRPRPPARAELVRQVIAAEAAPAAGAAVSVPGPRRSGSAAAAALAGASRSLAAKGLAG
ncbi:FAD-dependent oxidoreductase [Streptomyces monticola]|uniref:FAD-dependent oxidoreductase n=1 Tax=Streptomyces monticola TaxID=2666263 RepID=A0ABW2JWB5_9ACTN